MAHGIIGIDHGVVGVRDLDAAARRWGRLGFALCPRGRQLGRGNATCSIMFRDTHIELAGVVEPGQPDDGLGAFLAGREGITSLGWASADCAASVASLRAAGLGPLSVEDRSLQFELPETTLLLRTRLCPLPEAATPGIASFLIELLAPDALRRPEWLEHPNGAVALKGITVAIENPPALTAAYDALFAGHNVNRTDNVLTVHAGRQTLIFASPDDLSALQPDLDEADIPAPPAIVLMTLGSADLEQTADYLTQWQIEHDQHGAYSIVVPPAMATGVALEFVPA